MKNFSKMRQGLSCMVMALLLMLIPADIFAQNSISVSGIVMDDTNEPVIGAAVMVKGTTTGVITDIDGRYTISAPANGILSFSYVGLKDKEEKVNGRTTINIIMETDSKMIGRSGGDRLRNTASRIGDGCRFCRKRSGYDKDQERKSAEHADGTYSRFACMAEEL